MVSYRGTKYKREIQLTCTELGFFLDGDFFLPPPPVLQDCSSEQSLHRSRYRALTSLPLADISCALAAYVTYPSIDSKRNEYRGNIPSSPIFFPLLLDPANR